jgi:hypothetical protein
MVGWAALWTIGSALIMGHRLDRHMIRRRSIPPWYWRGMGAVTGLIHKSADMTALYRDVRGPSGSK